MGYDDEEAIKNALNVTSGNIKLSSYRLQMHSNIDKEMPPLLKWET